MTQASQLDALLAETRSGWSAAPADLGVVEALRSAGAAVPPLRFDGGGDDPFIAANCRLQADLQAAGVAHAYAEHEGGRGWDCWARHLEDTLRFFASTLSASSTQP